jgi:branched-chain amino acid aminotransferase
LLESSQNGDLKEIFGAGTAAVVSPIKGFSYKSEYHELPKMEDSFALQLKEELNNIQYNLAPDPFGWTVKI